MELKPHSQSVKNETREKIFGAMNIEVYLIGILCLFDVLQKDLMGYFKYLNLEELSSAPREFQQLQNGWCEKNSEDMLFIVFVFFHLILAEY